MNLIDEIKQSFRHGTALTRLIYINLSIFLIVNILNVVFFLFNASESQHFSLVEWLAVPASLKMLIIKPWTIFTYMFLHENFIHILFNMLWLYWFGKIFLQFLSEKQLSYIYILGGLTGAAFYILFFNVFPVFDKILTNSVALGASASVIAIVIAISVYVPDYYLYLIFIGRVKLKYIALFTICLDILSIPSSNSGGHIAHLGGALYGFLFALQMKKGNDLTWGYRRMIESLTSLFRFKKKMKVTHAREMNDWDYNAAKNEKQSRMDGILDKLAKSGYDSLTKEEKQFLFNMSDKK